MIYDSWHGARLFSAQSFSLNRETGLFNCQRVFFFLHRHVASRSQPSFRRCQALVNYSFPFDTHSVNIVPLRKSNF